MSADRLAEGTVVGNAYRIVRPLSAGGMGAVYVAEQLSTGKLRALKLMHTRLQADVKLRERFVKEARMASAIESAHVVEVIGAGVEEESGTPWLAMELLEGEDLGRHLSERGPLSAEEALALLEQIGHAVGEAHRLGIVHRDLKPENVFIAKTRAAGQTTTVKVLDFGIAKVVAEVKTMGTAAVGSPAWMAPEQADAGSEITPATDVWALGLLTFWMLTGASYWRTTSQPNVSMHAFLKEILFDALPTALKRARDIDAAERLPPGFDEWFDRAVHREPGARFRDADELVAAFRALVGGSAAPSVQASSARASSTQPVETAPMSTRAFVESSGFDTLRMATEQATDADRDAPTPRAARPARTVENAESPTLTPVLEGAASEPSRARALWAVAALVVVVGGAYAFVRTGVPSTGDGPGAESTPETHAAAPRDETVAEDHAADPTASVASMASTDISSAPRAARPVATTGAPPLAATTEATVAPSAPSASSSAQAQPELSPFNRFGAEAHVRARTSTAQFHCRGKFQDGVFGVTVGLVFRPDGSMARLIVDPMQSAQPSVICATNMLRHMTVAPFAGDKEETISATVTLQ